MFKKTCAAVGVGLFSLLLVAPASAQDVATLALTNGERPSGELLDMNAGGIYLKVNGQDQQFALNRIAAVEFVVGPVPSSAQSKIDSGQPFVLLRSGQVVDGRLSDISGSRPLKITIDTASGPREFSSNDVAQVWVNPVASSARETPPNESDIQVPANAIPVPANVLWTPTDIAIVGTQRITFNAVGHIMIGPGQSSGVGGSPAATVPNGRYPLRGAPAGALIGRVGTGAPFLIGGNTELSVRGNGRLQLGINDIDLGDNTGNFQVAVSRR